MFWDHPLHSQTKHPRLRPQKVPKRGQENSLRRAMRGLSLVKVPAAVVAALGGPVWALATPETVDA
jgi:hypothetical protein